MMTYRDEFREVQREAYWTVPRVALLLGFVALALGAVGFVGNIISQPARIVSKTLDADNVLTRYEWFYDANGNITSKIAQIRSFKTMKPIDDADASRLRMELAAVQQSCRDLSNRYNANAEKANVGIFQGGGVPRTVSVGACE